MADLQPGEGTSPHVRLQQRYEGLLEKYQQAVEQRSHSHWLGSWLIHEALDGVVLLCGGQITVANRSFYALASSRRRWVPLTQPDATSASLAVCLFAAAHELHTSDEAGSTCYFRTLETESRVIEARLHRLDQKPGQTAILLRDVSDREHLRLQYEESAHRDRFMAILAHELRNPLAPIVSAAELIVRGSDPETTRRAAEIILRQARHQARLVDDLLDVARVRQGKIVLQRQRHDLRVLLSEAAEATEEHRLYSGVGLEIELPPRPVWAWVDATRMVQSLVNLLVNAAKFTLPGGLNRMELEADANLAWVRLTDDGIGIDPSMLSRIFELFTQADETLDHSRGGLGLGLPLVRTLMELHGGGIRATSEGLGRGTQITLWVPVDEDYMQRAPETEPAFPLPLSPEEWPVPERARFVLVVEDNLDARETLCELLESVGHRVVSATNGLSALDVAREHRPDVVLCDIGLPGIDGFEVARRMRPEMPGVRLIALSGYSGNEDQQRAEAAGFDAYLVKPIDGAALIRAVAGS